MDYHSLREGPRQKGGVIGCVCYINVLYQYYWLREARFPLYQLISSCDPVLIFFCRSPSLNSVLRPQLSQPPLPDSSYFSAQRSPLRPSLFRIRFLALLGDFPRRACSALFVDGRITLKLTTSDKVPLRPLRLALSPSIH